MDTSNRLDGQTALQVTVDGKPVKLPEWLADSLTSVRTYLECVAMKRERVLWSLQVDGVKVDLTDAQLEMEEFQVIRASTISYDELAERLVAAGRTKVQDLLAEIQPASLLVLINGHDFAQQLWNSWEPQLREPLFSLRALKELNKTRENCSLEIPDPANFLDHLTFVSDEVDSLFFVNDEKQNEPDVVGFSEILDFTLVPLLKSLDAQFQLLQADQPGF
jgi:hypothetical protein